MLVPYNVDVPMERLPIANWILILATSALSLLILADVWTSDRRLHDVDALLKTPDTKELSREEVQKAIRALERPVLPPLALQPRHFALAQLVSHLFVHGDLLHLIGNMLFLFAFGNAVNAKLGHVGYLACYLFLGAMGGLAWMLLGGGRPMVGASGAIMGIVGVFFVLFPRNDIIILHGLTGMGSSRVSAIWVILFYFAVDLYGSLLGGGAAAYVAHLGGALTGFVLTIGLIQFGAIESTPYEENLLQWLGYQDKTARRSKARLRAKKLPRTVKPSRSAGEDGGDPAET